jgi:death-on-curing protein
MPNNITESDIVAVNKALGYHPLNVNLVGSALASIHYYPDIKTQIAAIVNSLIKNHAFQDGNKRTATVVYLTLCKRNGIRPIRDAALFDVVVKIASSKLNVEQVQKMLFL